MIDFDYLLIMHTQVRMGEHFDASEDLQAYVDASRVIKSKLLLVDLAGAVLID